jgi:hypothetical protein
LLVCNWPHSDWTKSLICKDAFEQGFRYSAMFSRDSAQFARQKMKFLVSRPDNVSFRPNTQLSKALVVRTTCHTVRTLIRLKHHLSGRHGFPFGRSSVSRRFELLQLASVRLFQHPIRTTRSVRPALDFLS